MDLKYSSSLPCVTDAGSLFSTLDTGAAATLDCPFTRGEELAIRTRSTISTRQIEICGLILITMAPPLLASSMVAHWPPHPLSEHPFRRARCERSQTESGHRALAIGS